MNRVLGGVLVGCAGMISAAVSQSSAVPPIAGEWDAAINTPGGVRNFKIVFRVDGDSLRGTVKRETGELPITGTIRGNAVNFSYTVNYNGNPLELTIAATVTGRDHERYREFGGMAEDEFSAKRAGPPGP